MRFEATEIPGVTVVRLERLEDERGFFARSWCAAEFAAQGLPADISQANISRTRRAATVRGLHFQRPPGREGKLVRCTRGRLVDVVVDLRCDSPAFLRHVAVELADDNDLALYVPPGVAHGFQTLVDEVDVHYLMTDIHRPDASGGVRWNDPVLGIRWPLEPSVVSQADRTWPDIDPERFDAFRGY